MSGWERCEETGDWKSSSLMFSLSLFSMSHSSLASHSSTNCQNSMWSESLHCCSMRFVSTQEKPLAPFVKIYFTYIMFFTTKYGSRNKAALYHWSTYIVYVWPSLLLTRTVPSLGSKQPYVVSKVSNKKWCQLQRQSYV